MIESFRIEQASYLVPAGFYAKVTSLVIKKSATLALNQATGTYNLLPTLQVNSTSIPCDLDFSLITQNTASRTYTIPFSTQNRVSAVGCSARRTLGSGTYTSTLRGFHPSDGSVSFSLSSGTQSMVTASFPTSDVASSIVVDISGSCSASFRFTVKKASEYPDFIMLKEGDTLSAINGGVLIANVQLTRVE